jgi:hypothetical protein
MFERSKGNIIIWIVINFFEIFSINYKVYILKAWHDFVFAHSKHSNFESGQSLFFRTKCAIPFENWIGFDIDDLNYLIS